jgi:hypothetical protein
LPEDEDAALSASIFNKAILLDCFDPLTLAHSQKDWLVEPAYQKLVYRKAGWVSALALVDGFVCGTWSKTRQGRNTKITMSPFKTLSKAQRLALEYAALQRLPDGAVVFAEPGQSKDDQPSRSRIDT